MEECETLNLKSNDFKLVFFSRKGRFFWFIVFINERDRFYYFFDKNVSDRNCQGRNIFQKDSREMKNDFSFQRKTNHFVGIHRRLIFSGEFGCDFVFGITIELGKDFFKFSLFSSGCTAKEKEDSSC